MGDVEALAEVLGLANGYDLNADPTSSTAREMRPEFEDHARAVLASPWLAAYVAAARAEERERLARIYDQRANEWEATALGAMGIGVDRGRFKAFRDAATIAREDLRPREGA